MPFENNQHLAEYRIYYEDTDAGGIVYHANYLKYAERARSDALREMGIIQRELRETQGVFFVLRHADITYLAPILLEDVITVNSTVTHVGNSSLRMQQTIWRNGVELCRMLMHIVCVSNDKKAVRIPEEVITLIKAHMMALEEED